MSTIRPQGVLRRCKLYVGYQIYTVKSKKCNFETPKKWAKWSMEALNHIFYINMGLNCPTEVVSQFSIFSPNTPLQDHCGLAKQTCNGIIIITLLLLLTIITLAEGSLHSPSNQGEPHPPGFEQVTFTFAPNFLTTFTFYSQFP